MVIKKTLASIVLASAIGLSGCSDKTYLEGRVVSEFGSAAGLVESTGAFFGNDSVKVGDPTYGLIMDNGKKRYYIRVYDDARKPIIALAQAIEPGDRIRIENNRYLTMGDDGIGSTSSNRVEIIEKKK